MPASDIRDQVQSALASSYTILRELGGGGMSYVFVAEEPALGRMVVIKVLATDRAEGVSAVRFSREIRLVARLQHPHIVPLFATGSVGGVPYYTMPYVEGESLRARLSREKTLATRDAIHILGDIAKLGVDGSVGRMAAALFTSALARCEKTRPRLEAWSRSVSA